MGLGRIHHVNQLIEFSFQAFCLTVDLGFQALDRIFNPCRTGVGFNVAAQQQQKSEVGGGGGGGGGGGEKQADQFAAESLLRKPKHHCPVKGQSAWHYTADSRSE